MSKNERSPLLDNLSGSSVAIEIDDLGDKSTPKMGLLACITLLSKCCMGAGLLGIPYCFKCMGLFGGLFLLLFVGFLSFFTFALLAEARHYTGETTYDSLMVLYYKKPGAWLVQFSLFSLLWGAAVLYGVVLADNFFGIFQGFGILVDRPLILALAFLAIFPLTLYNQLSPLRYTSNMGLLCLLYLLGVILFEFPNPAYNEDTLDQVPPVTGPIWQAFQFNFSFFQAVPILMGAYCGQFNALGAINELENPTRMRATIVMAGCVLTCFVFYAVFSTVGYLTFGAMTQGNLLRGYSPTASLVAGEVALTVTLLLTIPLFILPLRNITFSSFGRNPDSVGRPMHFGVTVLLIGSVLATAILAKDVRIVLGILGATSGNLVSFIMPAMIGYKLYESQDMSLGRSACIFVIAFSALSMVAGIYTTLAVTEGR